MVNANEILKNVMNSKQAVFVKIPFPLTVNEDDFTELSSKLGEKVLKECYEQAIREYTAELVAATRKQSLNVPIKETMKHEVRGEYSYERQESKSGAARKDIVEYLKKNEGKKFSTRQLCELLNLDDKTFYNAVNKNGEGIASVHKEKDSETGSMRWFYASESDEISSMLPSGTKISAFGGVQ